MAKKLARVSRRDPRPAAGTYVARPARTSVKKREPLRSFGSPENSSRKRRPTTLPATRRLARSTHVIPVVDGLCADESFCCCGAMLGRRSAVDGSLYGWHAGK